MLKMNHCSNSECHKPYLIPADGKMIDIREEVVVQLGNGSFTRISLCPECYMKNDENIVKNAFKEVADYHEEEIKSDRIISQERKNVALDVHKKVRKLIAWGRNEDELRDKIKDKKNEN